ncbi:MAG: hypothetical protein H6658_08645 [Ardenticatenaceae bacterium]|nr:hypothetical protein [Ardenticatenaceae bacterium]
MAIEVSSPRQEVVTKVNWRARLQALRWVWLPTVAFVVTRLGVVLAIYLGAVLITESSSPPPYHLRPPDNIFVDALGSRWDTGFYVSIVEEGYILHDVPLPNAAFFPLLPLLMKAVLPLAGDELVAGMVVSNVALWLAVILFYCLVQMSWGAKVADRAVWYMLIFPMAFFGSAVYTESLFLLTAIGALYFARRGYWESAALMGIAATLTRFVGLIVAPMLLLEWWMQWRAAKDEGGKRPSLLALLAPLATPLGTGAFMFYLWRKFGNPLAFMDASSAWGRVPQNPLVTIGELFHAPAGGWWPALMAGQIHLDNWIDFSFVLVFLILGLVLLYERRWSEGVFVLLGVIIPFSSGLLMSQRRYMWVLFPVFILLARWGERPWVDKLVTAVSLVGLAIFTALFANGYWVA